MNYVEKRASYISVICGLCGYQGINCRGVVVNLTRYENRVDNAVMDRIIRAAWVDLVPGISVWAASSSFGRRLTTPLPQHAAGCARVRCIPGVREASFSVVYSLSNHVLAWVLPPAF